MTSYFSEQHHIDSLSAGFDLIGDQLDELMMIDIITTMDDALESNPTDINTILALEAANDAIGERDDALAVLANYTQGRDQSLVMLRTAQHLMHKGEGEESKRLLAAVILRASEETKTDDWSLRNESTVNQLCALIAYGRMDDKELFIETWYRYIEEDGLKEPFPEEDLISNPESYALFDLLPLRESIEGIGYLAKFSIRECRDAEILSHAYIIQDYLEGLLVEIIHEGKMYGFTECLPAFLVVHAFSKGGIREIEKIKKDEGLVFSPAVSEAIDSNIRQIQRTGIMTLIMNTVMHWSFNAKRTVPDLVSTLRKQTGGDDELIAEIVDLMGAELPVGCLHEIFSILKVPGKYQARISGKEREHVRRDERVNEALGFYGHGSSREMDGRWYEDLHLKNLRESHKNEEAFAYLAGQMNDGHLLHLRAILFELALSFDTSDDLLALKPLFISQHIMEGLHLVNAYEQMAKKDVKRGLEFIEQAKRDGLSDDIALIFSARFLLQSGYPKRAVGIAEKMLKQNIPADLVYPLLIQAYRDLGREGDANVAKAKYLLVRNS